MRTQLWLDDIHSPETSPMELENPTWVKNSKDFKIALDYAVDLGLDGTIDAISFDNDLGEETEGYHLFLYLEEYLHKGKFYNLRTINVHSDNTSRVTMFLSAKPVFKKQYNVDILRLRRITD